VTRRLPASLAAVAFAAGAVLAGPAPAAQAASCEAGAGVTVVVDFAALSGGVGTRCAAGDPDTGVQALTGAGYSPERAVQERSGYFLCRIDGKPASDPCQRAASSSAYWSYWHAKPGGTWSFSNTGPGTFDPAPGSVEGWAYGAGKPPSVAPPAAAPPQPAAPPADQPPPAQAPPAQTPASEPSRAQAAGSPAPAAKPKPTRTADSSAAGSSPAVSPPAETATALGAPETATPPESVSPEPSSAPETSTSPEPTSSPEPSAAPDDPEATPTSTRTDGSPAGPLAAALLVLALVTAGGWQLVRRRREQL
ncbi:MAG: hypothetical protein M3486_02885, partial [Actinomycetota bacterium]|nr:hypothetical protein [Actinomycetota bacterium]